MSNSFPTINPDEVARLKAKIGEKRPVTDPFNEYATKDNIRHFVHGMGDNNPLFTDEAHAAKSRWGCIVAPPTILFSMLGWNFPRGLPGIHGMWAGAEFDCFLPIKVNDRIKSVLYLSKLEEKVGKFAGRMILQEVAHDFTNQDGKLVAINKQWTMRTERDAARKNTEKKVVPPQEYSAAELAAIEKEIEKEEIRGAKPRYWEDVKVGDDIAPIVKGPLTIRDNVAWKIGWGNRPFCFAHGIALEYQRRHPATGIKNALGVPDVPERVHWDNDFAREVGVSGAYDYGPQRLSWVGQVMTNWMGDDGFLKHLRVEIRGFNMVGDTTWCRGKVTAKKVADGQRLVDCEVWSENQRHEKTAQGEATVILPSRKA